MLVFKSRRSEKMKDKINKLVILFVILFLSAAISFAKDEKKDKKILYYRNPMNPSITSPTFMKDSMGMDYIPVYEEDGVEENLQEGMLVKISKGQQELIGVKTEPVITRPLMRMVRTVAKIAFDPELYKTEQEFIQAYKTSEAINSKGPSEINERLESLVVASAL